MIFALTTTPPTPRQGKRYQVSRHAGLFMIVGCFMGHANAGAS
jgi:hypothetical protein